jgi:uncharacterized protein
MLGLAMVVAIAAPSQAQHQPIRLSIAYGLPGTAQVSTAIVEVDVVASTVERGTGLSGRTEIDLNGGMLFVMPRDVRPCVWMKDTQMPLLMAFIRADGRVVKSERLQPLNSELRCAPEPIRFVLEVHPSLVPAGSSIMFVGGLLAAPKAPD